MASQHDHPCMTFLGPTKHTGPAGQLTIRRATLGDRPAIDQLAVLDNRRAPRGTVLVADVSGPLWAALSVEDFHAVADPFRPSAELVLLLAERARQLRREARPRRRVRLGRRR